MEERKGKERGWKSEQREGDRLSVCPAALLQEHYRYGDAWTQQHASSLVTPGTGQSSKLVSWCPRRREWLSNVALGGVKAGYQAHPRSPSLSWDSLGGCSWRGSALQGQSRAPGELCTHRAAVFPRRGRRQGSALQVETQRLR